MDPILKYLLDFNKTNSIEYQGRLIIPLGGLEEMLKNYKKFHLNREEEEKQAPTTEEELYKLLD